MGEPGPLVPRESEQDCTARKSPNPCLSVPWVGPGQVLMQGWLRNGWLDSGAGGISLWPATSPQPLLVLAACLIHRGHSSGCWLGKKKAATWPHPQSPPGLSPCWEGRGSQHHSGEGEHPQPSVGPVPAQQELPSPSPVPRWSWQLTVLTTHQPLACWRLSRFSPLCCALCLF